LTRRFFIERALRQIYGTQQNDDSWITVNLVNAWLPDAIGIAAKQNYKDNIALDGISYVNNSFYTTFKDIDVTKDEQFLWKVQLPEIPVGIGANMGVSTLQFKDSSSAQISPSVIWITENQRTYFQSMRTIPNKLLAYQQGEFVYIISQLILSQYAANVTMVSGGDSSDLDSTLNVPPDYFPVMVEYIKQQLVFERNQPVDVNNDGNDSIRTT
jgi:hypothetical protein